MNDLTNPLFVVVDNRHSPDVLIGGVYFHNRKNAEQEANRQRDGRLLDDSIRETAIQVKELVLSTEENTCPNCHSPRICAGKTNDYIEGDGDQWSQYECGSFLCRGNLALTTECRLQVLERAFR